MASASLNQAIGHNIRTVRLNLNYTQFYMSVKLNISQNTYSKVELGKTKLTIDRVLLIAELLETDPMSLLIIFPVVVYKKP